MTQPALADYTLAHMTGVVITARDGLELPCYLSLPVLPEGQVPCHYTPACQCVVENRTPACCCGTSLTSCKQYIDVRRCFPES